MTTTTQNQYALAMILMMFVLFGNGDSKKTRKEHSSLGLAEEECYHI